VSLLIYILMKHNIYFIIILISALCQGQNLIIKNGQFNDAYDRDIIKDISIGNVCEQEFFLNLYYNGDMYLKGDVYINHSILTVYGNLHKENNILQQKVKLEREKRLEAESELYHFKK